MEYDKEIIESFMEDLNSYYERMEQIKGEIDYQEELSEEAKEDLKVDYMEALKIIEFLNNL